MLLAYELMYIYYIFNSFYNYMIIVAGIITVLLGIALCIGKKNIILSVASLMFCAITLIENIVWLTDSMQSGNYVYSRISVIIGAIGIILTILLLLIIIPNVSLKSSASKSFTRNLMFLPGILILVNNILFISAFGFYGAFNFIEIICYIMGIIFFCMFIVPEKSEYIQKNNTPVE